MQQASYLTAGKAFIGIFMCFLMITATVSCGLWGLSHADVAKKIKAEKKAMQFQIDLLKSGKDATKKKISGACDRLTTNINLLDILISNPGITPIDKSQLEAIRDEAIAAKENLACP